MNFNSCQPPAGYFSSNENNLRMKDSINRKVAAMVDAPNLFNKLGLKSLVEITNTLANSCCIGFCN